MSSELVEGTLHYLTFAQAGGALVFEKKIESILSDKIITQIGFQENGRLSNWDILSSTRASPLVEVSPREKWKSALNRFKRKFQKWDDHDLPLGVNFDDQIG